MVASVQYQLHVGELSPAALAQLLNILHGEGYRWPSGMQVTNLNYARVIMRNNEWVVLQPNGLVESTANRYPWIDRVDVAFLNNVRRA